MIADTFHTISQEEPEAWLVDLMDELSEEFLLVANSVVQRVPLSAVIIGSLGLAVLHPRDWKEGTFTSPTTELRETEQALQSYLLDEFPDLHPTVIHFVVLTNPQADVVVHSPATGARVVRLSDLASEIIDQAELKSNPVLDRASCEALAAALQNRQLSRNQRAGEPFIFGAGKPLRRPYRAWTLHQVFRYMDRYPKDGMEHMASGTLVDWFAKQGALDLVHLVKEILSGSNKDQRLALEELLAKSGLLHPRGLIINPKILDLGRIIKGTHPGSVFMVRSTAQQGYIAVTLKPDVEWLHLEPVALTGTTGLVTVQVDTTQLPIIAAPYEANVLISSPIFANPITLPVRVRVVNEPTRFSLFLRPLSSLLAASVLGGLIGLAMGMWGVPPPAWLSGLVPNLSPIAIWGIIFSLFWVFWTLVSGLRQPLALPIGKALLRWLGGVALWIVCCGLLAITAAWALRIFYPALVAAVPTLQITIVLVVIGLAIIPAVMTQDFDLSERKVQAKPRPRLPRFLAVGVSAIILTVIVYAGVSWLPSLWSVESGQNPVTTVAGWAATQLDAFQAWIDRQIESYTLDQKDRRAPAQLTPLPTVKAVQTKAP